jgi:multicomponent Na+:H+ antiporter subunit G
VSIVAVVLTAVGAALLVIAAWGVIVLPDALSRQHAATKAGTLALALVLIGAWLLMPSGEWAWRLVLILGFLLATLPVASHLLARAAVVEADLEDTIHNAPLIGDDPA